MPDTLSEYMESEDWGAKDTDAKLNAMATYIIDLENKVERLEHDLDVIDGGY